MGPAERGRPGVGRDDGTDELVDQLVQSAFATMAVLTRVGAENDLSLSQLRALAILRDRRLSMTALGDYLGLEKSTMTGLVDRGERRGLLERAPDRADRRVVEVFLTEAGADLADRLAGQIGRLLAPAANDLSSLERRRLSGLLERVRDPRAARGDRSWIQPA